MQDFLTSIPIRLLFGINIVLGLVLFYFLAIVQEVDPGQFPWLMNFMFYVAISYMMVVLVEKQSNPYHVLGGYFGSFAVMFSTAAYLIENAR